MAIKKKRLPEGPFYRDLGRMIRLTRVAAGKSQGDIAEHLHLTFQQVQKYETGSNRIPVDYLVSLASYLDVPLSHFIGAGRRPKAETAFLALIEKFEVREFKALLEAWAAIPDQKARFALLNVVKCMADLAG